MDLDINTAPGWEPAEGDTIIGEVVGLDRMRSSYGDQDYYPIVTIRLEGPATAREPGGSKGDTQTLKAGDLLAVHGFHYVLKNELSALRPTRGERLGVKFVGQKDSKDSKRTVTVYTVKVDGREADIWSGMGDARPMLAASSDVPDDGAFTPEAKGDGDIPF